MWGYHSLILKKANWARFVHKCKRKLSEISLGDRVIEDWCSGFSSLVIQSASQTKEKKKIRQNKKAVPWWNLYCDRAMRVQNADFKKLRGYPMAENGVVYKRLRVKACRIIKSSMRECWRAFCRIMGMETPLNKMMVFKLF